MSAQGRVTLQAQETERMTVGTTGTQLWTRRQTGAFGISKGPQKRHLSPSPEIPHCQGRVRGTVFKVSQQDRPFPGGEERRDTATFFTVQFVFCDLKRQAALWPFSGTGLHSRDGAALWRDCHTSLSGDRVCSAPPP